MAEGAFDDEAGLFEVGEAAAEGVHGEGVTGHVGGAGGDGGELAAGGAVVGGEEGEGPAFLLEVAAGLTEVGGGEVGGRGVGVTGEGVAERPGEEGVGWVFRVGHRRRGRRGGRGRGRR